MQLITHIESLHEFHSQTTSAIKEYFASRVYSCFLPSFVLCSFHSSVPSIFPSVYPSLMPFAIHASSYLTGYYTLLKIITMRPITLAKSMHNFHSQISSAIKHYFVLGKLSCFRSSKMHYLTTLYTPYYQK